MPKTFVQLTKQDCTYLLNLINELDSNTTYTARQRTYTIPKLVRISQDPGSVRLAFQDVDYLLELIDDDEMEEDQELREAARKKLEEIKNLQIDKYEHLLSIQEQREQRKLARTNTINKAQER